MRNIPNSRPTVDYAAIAQAALARSRTGWARRFQPELTARLHFAGLFSEALVAADDVPGLSFEKLLIGDGFALKMVDQQIDYELRVASAELIRTMRKGTVFTAVRDQQTLRLAVPQDVPQASRDEIGSAVAVLVQRWQ